MTCVGTRSRDAAHARLKATVGVRTPEQMRTVEIADSPSLDDYDLERNDGSARRTKAIERNDIALASRRGHWFAGKVTVLMLERGGGRQIGVVYVRVEKMRHGCYNISLAIPKSGYLWAFFGIPVGVRSFWK